MSRKINFDDSIHRMVMQMCIDTIVLHTNSSLSTELFNFHVVRENRKTSFTFSAFDSHVGGVLSLSEGKLVLKLLAKNKYQKEVFNNTITCKTKKNGELTDSLKTVMKSLFTNPSVVSMGEFIHKLIIDCKQSSEDADLIQKIINESPAEMVEETTDAAS